MPDYIPAPDGDFYAWEQNFTHYVEANTVALGLLPADVAPLTNAQGFWTLGYGDSTAKQAAARAAVDLKCQNRASYETIIRALVRRLQASPTVTDQQRLAMGITVKGNDPPMAPVATHPAAFIDAAERFQHRIRFVDAADPTRRARPHGVIGCEIWVKVGEPPADPSELHFLAMDTHSPYLAEFTGADAGKAAHYMLRWVFSTGEKGSWSETASATIPG